MMTYAAMSKAPSSGRDDPEVFDDAKDYVFQAMEGDAFPGMCEEGERGKRWAQQKGNR